MMLLRHLFPERLSYALSSSKVVLTLLLLRCSLDPMLNMTRHDGRMGLGALLNLILIVFSAITWMKNHNSIPIYIFKVWGGILTTGITSIFISPISIDSARSFLSILTYFSIFSLPFFIVKTREDLIFIFKLVFCSAIIPFFWSFIELASAVGEHDFRLRSTFTHSNIFAFYLVLIITLVFFFIKSHAFCFQSIKWLVILLVLGVVLLSLTKTRSAWIALTCIIVIYGLINERKYLIYGFIAGLILLLIPSIQERIADLFVGNDIEQTLQQGYGKLNSFAWRKVVWSSSWEFITLKPLLGHGYNTFNYYFLQFFPLGANRGFDAHNMYVQVAFDMGFLGLAGLLFLFVKLLHRISIYCRYDRSGGVIIFGFILSYMVVGYSDNMLFYLSYNWYFWLIMGLFSKLAKRQDLIFVNSDDEKLKYQDKSHDSNIFS